MSNTETAIALPFSIDDAGNVRKTYLQEKIWADRVTSVIGTSIGERVMRNDFGTDIRSSLFNTQSAMENVIEDTITDAFTSQLPLLDLGDISYTHDEVTNVMEVTITYALPNRQITTVNVPVTIGTISISGNNLPKEVI
jgi:phage baseplate assembly protein W